jgi:hypothetical protein
MEFRILEHVFKLVQVNLFFGTHDINELVVQMLYEGMAGVYYKKGVGCRKR